MLSRFRQFIESIVFAGLKPKAPRKEANHGGWYSRLLARVERGLAGHAPTDPLYLSNRTWKQKLRLGLAVGVPGVLLVSVMALAFSNLFPRTVAPPPRELTPAELVAKLLPDLEKTVKVDTNPDAELVEVHVQRGASPMITGLLRNRSGRQISVEFALELTDDAGSRLGAVVGRVDKAPAKNTVPFQFPIKQENAAFALVREVHTVQ